MTGSSTRVAERKRQLSNHIGEGAAVVHTSVTLQAQRDHVLGIEREIRMRPHRLVMVGIQHGTVERTATAVLAAKLVALEDLVAEGEPFGAFKNLAGCHG